MTEARATSYPELGVEDVLRVELAEGDAVIGTLAPVLRHLLAHDDHSLFSDEIVARVRGMLSHLARQLLHALIDTAADEGGQAVIEEQEGAMVGCLLDHAGLLRHLHALALETQLTERLQERNAVDPILSPLLQALIGSSDAVTAGFAMTALAAQARFVQCQRRMELPLAELPGDLFHVALMALRSQARDGDAVERAESELRAGFDESHGRLGLLSRLVIEMGGGAIAALAVEHAGVAIFLTALAIGSGQERDLAVLSTNDRLLARFALSLRAAGLKSQAVREQFAALHPEITLPEGFEQLAPDHAATLLSASNPVVAG